MWFVQQHFLWKNVNINIPIARQLPSPRSAPALLRHVHLHSRAGNHRTAMESAKLLYSLDPDTCVALTLYHPPLVPASMRKHRRGAQDCHKSHFSRSFQTPSFIQTACGISDRAFRANSLLKFIQYSLICVVNHHVSIFKILELDICANLLWCTMTTSEIIFNPFFWKFSKQGLG